MLVARGFGTEPHGWCIVMQSVFVSYLLRLIRVSKSSRPLLVITLAVGAETLMIFFQVDVYECSVHIALVFIIFNCILL